MAKGVVLLVTRGNVASLANITFAIGDVWMLTAAIIFAIYSILIRHKPAGLSIWSFQLSTFILGLVFLFPFFIWEYTTSPPVEFDPKTVGSILYVGIFASLSAFVLWNKEIMAIGPTKAGMILLYPAPFQRSPGLSHFKRRNQYGTFVQCITHYLRHPDC